MGSIWLADLADVFRADNPLDVPIIEVGANPGVVGDAWKRRSRSTGGYDGLRGFVVHHTAEGKASDGWQSANFQTFYDADRPNTPLYLSRKPELFICAAGACNTQGRGQWGRIPLDQGNRYATALEIGNDGVGEPYPARQQDAVLWVVATWLRHYGPRFGMTAADVCAHFEYAPTRKRDPFGPSQWSPTGERWDMNAFRSAVAAAVASGGDDMPLTDEDVKKIWDYVIPRHPFDNQEGSVPAGLFLAAASAYSKHTAIVAPAASRGDVLAATKPLLTKADYETGVQRVVDALAGLDVTDVVKAHLRAVLEESVQRYTFPAA